MPWGCLFVFILYFVLYVIDSVMLSFIEASKASGVPFCVFLFVCHSVIDGFCWATFHVIDFMSSSQRQRPHARTPNHD